jgi:hypothetical protein
MRTSSWRTSTTRDSPYPPSATLGVGAVAPAAGGGVVTVRVSGTPIIVECPRLAMVSGHQAGEVNDQGIALYPFGRNPKRLLGGPLDNVAIRRISGAVTGALPLARAAVPVDDAAAMGAMGGDGLPAATVVPHQQVWMAAPRLDLEHLCGPQASQRRQRDEQTVAFEPLLLLIEQRVTRASPDDRTTTEAERRQPCLPEHQQPAPRDCFAHEGIV